MTMLDISQLARRCGLPASTLRYYEEKGLIASCGRRGLKRLFDGAVLDRLSLIALGRMAGFSLGEIGEMLGRDGGRSIDRALLERRADELDRRIKRLGGLRDALRHAAACSAPNHMECKTFHRLRKIAQARAPRRKGDVAMLCETL